MTRCRDTKDNKQKKLILQTSSEMLVKRDQTFSATKGSIGRFGNFKSRTDVDDTRGLVRMYAADRKRKPAKVTLVPMPWDKT